ncbi:MAG: PhnD/SsuA/transferrin family substrate-binding protein [Proteobacteria bacterium]|nr:PhnD/SsuA/transferrin family substrate-binding protein [Pseudomonadota bacterium]
MTAGIAVLFGGFVVASLPVAAKEAGEKTLRIGVLAFRGVEHTQRSWMPMARYLSTGIADTSFRIVPLRLQELRQATRDGSIDYVLTNPGQYVELEETVGIHRILTLKKAISGGISNVYGATIFVRADRNDIKKLSDLKGKVFGAVAPRAFGGFQMAWREFKAAGIDPFKDFKEIRSFGFPQDDIVFAVRDGLVDAGTVRTDILETMAEADNIDIKNFRILNKQTLAGNKMLLSTRLYPEWPLAAMPHVAAELSEKVALALLSLNSDSPEMLAAGYTGWTVPLDYKPVHDLFRDLELGPYVRQKPGILDLLARYLEWVVFASVLMVLIILHGIRTEYLVQRRTRELSEVNRELEHEIHERQSAEEQVRQHESELAHVSRVSVIGEMTSGLAHELRQPLSAIRNYAEGGIRRLQRNNGDTSDLGEALNQINQQAGRAAQIIARVRGYMRKREPRREAVDLNHAVEEAVTLFRHDARNSGVVLRLELAPNLPPVLGDLIEIEQMIINLGRNALDAMAGTNSNNMGRPSRLEIVTTGSDAGIAVRVSDTGPGLSDDALEKIWEPFMTTKENGLGLGLSICRSIAEAHGGRIWAETAETGGLSVTFLIPAIDPNVDEEADHGA